MLLRRRCRLQSMTGKILEYNLPRLERSESDPDTVRIRKVVRAILDIVAHTRCDESAGEFLPDLLEAENASLKSSLLSQLLTFSTVLCVSYASLGLIVIAPSTHLSKP